MMWINDSSWHIRQVLTVGIVSILAVVSVGPTCSLPFDHGRRDGRRLLEGGLDGGHLQLLHWSHPEAPHHVPGLSFTERMQLSVRSSTKRVAALMSGKMQSESLGRAAPWSSKLAFEAPLFHEGFEYATEISIGTPPQKSSVLVDTGRDLVWVKCQGCDYCQPLSNPRYDPTKSLTYSKMSCTDPLCLAVKDSCPKNKTCNYAYGYGLGAIYGVMSYESITLTSTTGTTTTTKMFAFGCGYEVLLNFGRTGNIDGMLGLSLGPLSLPSQLGSLYGNKFSYCLVSTYDSNTTTSPLLFGDAAVPNARVHYTPMVQNPNASHFGSETFYYIGLKGIKVNGIALDIPSGTFDILPNGTGGTFLDSGTALTFLADAAYRPLLKRMQSLIEYKPIHLSTVIVGLELCYDLANVSRPIFPKITMVFEGFSLELPSDNVFIRFDGDNGPSSNSTVYCMGIAGNYGPTSIFGNLQQQNFQILYDREAKRYGFAKVNCDKLTSGY